MPEDYEPIPINEEDKNAFNDALKKAVDTKVSIENNSKAKYAELSNEFADFMVDRVSDDFKDNIAPILGLYSNISPELKGDKKDKRQKAALRSFFKSMYDKSTDMILHKDDGWPKESSTSKVYGLVKNLFVTLWLAKDVPEIKSMLNKVGIEVNFNHDVDVISDGSEENENDVKARNQILEEGVAALRDTAEKNIQIEDEIFPLIHENLRYDAASNPKGIRKGQFTSLATVNAKKMLLESAGEVDKAKDLVNKTAENFFYGSINQKLLFDTYQQVS